VSGERWTDGHVLAIDGRPSDSTFEVNVALFNSIPYRIPMCRCYMGHRYARGHHFNMETREATEMQVAIAGPDFDPSTILKTRS